MNSTLSYDPLISEIQRTQFLNDGFLRVDGILDEEERQWLLGLYDELFETSDRKQLGGLDANGRETLPQIFKPSEKVPALKESRLLQRATELARFLLGDDVTWKGEHMIMKPAGYGSPTPWHQDQAYHSPDHHFTNVNIWVPLEDATIENGCMQFVRGSHRGPVLPHTWLVEGDKKSAMVATDQAYWSANATAVPCPAGSATLHHSYMMHYAGPNLTDQARRAYILVFYKPPERLEQPWVFPWR